MKMRTWCLLGAPNSGKTTLYNWLTDSNFRAVNYPGSTVEYCEGRLSEKRIPKASAQSKDEFIVLDTPGTYSLFPKSQDEEVTLQVLLGKKTASPPMGLILVIDGTQLERQLLLLRQLQDFGFYIIVALTMKDLLRRVGVSLSPYRLSQKLGVRVVEVDGTTGEGIDALVEQMFICSTQLDSLCESRELQAQNAERSRRLLEDSNPWTPERVHKERKKIAEILHSVDFDSNSLKSLLVKTKKMDKWVLSENWGLPIFFLVMAAFFSSIFWLAQPFMDLVDFGFSFVSQEVLHFNENSLLNQFLSQAIVQSMGSVFVFVPQIFILFFGLSALESSGYLARAAALVDKPFARLGMSGRSFVPTLSGFACAVPAIMSTRNIPTFRDRLITTMMIPLFTCSARLPVYSLLLLFLFQGSALKQGLLLAALYIGSLLLGLVAAAVLNRFLPKEKNSFFLMELPIYRRPKLKVSLNQAVLRTKSYIKRAGPVIFVFGILVWIGTTFPNWQLEDQTERLHQSYLAQLGRNLEPIFRPLGVDWRVGVGLMSAFAAREVFVSSLAVLFRIGESPDNQDGLLNAMREATFSDGTPVFSVASEVALILFFMIALQCISTFSVNRRELGSWKWATMQLILFNVVAYMVAAFAYRIIA